MSLDLPHDVIDRVHRTGKKAEIEDIGETELAQLISSSCDQH